MGVSSGSGSDVVEAEAKAAYLNEFVSDHGVHSVIELGCGDATSCALPSIRVTWASM